MGHRVLKWLSWSGIDAIGRLAMLTVGTAVMSRLVWSRRGRFLALAPAWALVASMGLLVFGVSPYIPDFTRLGSLTMTIGLGVAAYAALVAVFAREQFAGMAAMFATRATPVAR